MSTIRLQKRKIIPLLNVEALLYVALSIRAKNLELFCETCEELICCKCAIRGGKHHNHDYKCIQESFETYKEDVTPLLESMEKQVPTIIQMLVQLDRKHDEITHQQETVQEEIQESSERLHKIIDTRKDSLINQLDKITRRKMECLVIQKDRLKTLQARLNSCSEMTREGLKTAGSAKQLL